MILVLFLITRNLCALALWIHKGYSVVKKLVWNVRMKAFWNSGIQNLLGGITERFRPGFSKIWVLV